MLARAGRAGVTVVISDLLNEGWDVAIDRLVAGGGDTSVLHVLADDELDPDLRGDLAMIDVETGQEVPASLSPAQLREYAEHVEAWLAETSAHCVRNGATYVRVMADDAPRGRPPPRLARTGSRPMRFANPAGLALLALAIPVILTHILRPRRLPVTVSSTMLWRKLERPVAAAKPWQRLRWSLLLLAQLLAVTGLALAVARPERVEASPLAAAHRVHHRRVRRRWRRPTAHPTDSPTPSTAPSSCAASSRPAAWRRS